MYPHVTQFETSRRLYERELRLIRERKQARAARSAHQSSQGREREPALTSECARA